MWLSRRKTRDYEKNNNQKAMSEEARVHDRIDSLYRGQMGSYRPEEMKATDCADLIRKAFKDKQKGDFDGFLDGVTACNKPDTREYVGSMENQDTFGTTDFYTFYSSHRPSMHPEDFIYRYSRSEEDCGYDYGDPFSMMSSLYGNSLMLRDWVILDDSSPYRVLVELVNIYPTSPCELVFNAGALKDDYKRIGFMVARSKETVVDDFVGFITGKAFKDDGNLAVYPVVKDIGYRNMLRYGWLGTKPLF